MSEKQKPIKITVQRGDDGAPGVVEYEHFVLIGWDENDDGSRQTFTQTSAPPGEDADHLLHGAKALAKAMKKHKNPAAMAIGTIVENTIQKGMEYLEEEAKKAASDG